MTRSAAPFSYEQTFDELFEIFNKRLAIEGLPPITASVYEQEILEVSQVQFPSHELETDMLQEDITSFATAFFLPKNSALIINRYFDNPHRDAMSDIADVLDLAEFLDNQLIAFIYRGGAHFMSVVVNVEKGQVRFTNSFKRGDYDFNENAHQYLLPVLERKFDKPFAIKKTPQDERVEQIGDATTCNVHSMLNIIIGVLEEKGVEYQKIAVFVSGVLGVKIEAQNIQDLIKSVAEQFTTDEQKANLQKRMVCASQIYRRLVGDIYPKSASNIELESLVKDKSKSDAFLTGVLEVLCREPKYQKLAGLMLQINNSVTDAILGNNFSLNPDLKFGCDKDELKDFVFSREKTMSRLEGQGLFANIQEVFEMIDAFYLSIGEGEITPELLESAVRAIEEMDLTGLDSADLQFDSDEEIDGNLLHQLFDEEEDVKLKTVQKLLDQGNDPNQINSNGDSPFHIACSMSADPEIIKLLIKKGADLSLCDAGNQNGLDILIATLPKEDSVELRLKSYELVRFILEENPRIENVATYQARIDAMFDRDKMCKALQEKKSGKRKDDGGLEGPVAKRMTPAERDITS